jgi:nucleotide-binding universal stress UspA family protein
MATMQRILCPVDFSATSEHGAAHAAALARWSGARLYALHVQSPVTQRLPEPPDERRSHESDVEHIYGRIRDLLTLAGTPTDAFEVIVDLGEPVEHILARAASLPADLIVMGTHGTGGFERLVLGSVAEKVLRRAPCDVLVIPPGSVGKSRLPYRSIVCAVDFSDCSRKALDVAGRMAAEADAALSAVHVIGWPWDEPPPPDFSGLPPDQAAALREYRRYLETSATTRLRDWVSAAGAPADRTTVHVAHGSSYRGVLQAADESRADLIVLGVHGRGAIDLAVFGSTANQVVRRAACPVWLAREPGAAGRVPGG